jgi:5'-nucleotidase/UDP-sugar diphosphatase
MQTRCPLSRRAFLHGTAAAGAAALSPIVAFRARAQAGPGELLMVPSVPNPAGAAQAVWLLQGDPLAGPIAGIVTEAGNPAPAPMLAEGDRRVLRLFHFNDMHNHMTDMHASRGDTHRMAQMVQQVNAARAAAGPEEAVLFLSAGDDHTGSIFDELMGWDPEGFVADPGYRAASGAGVDLAVLGNHEFDRGAALLRIGIERDAAFPVLSANVHGSAHLDMNRDYAPAAVIEAKGLRVGVIGLTTAVDTRVGQPSDPGLAVASPVAALTNLMPAVAGISDVVVILSHCGYGSGQHQSGKAGAARLIGEGDFDIAAAAGPLTDKPVVLIGGHSHTVLNAPGLDPDNMIDGVLIAQAGANGSHLGEVSMSIAAEAGRKAWFSHVGLHGIKRRDDRVAADDPARAGTEQDGDYDAEFEAAHIAPLVALLDDKLAETIGRVTAGAAIGTERTIAQRYVGELALANYMNDALVARSATFPNGPVDLALFNATGVSAGVADGPLSFRQWYDVMPYADAIHVARMTGAQIQAMLDSNAKRIVRPEEAGATDMAGFVSRGFLHFSGGLRYRIDLGASAAGARAVDVTVDGKPIADLLSETFTMAINTYIALGAFGEAWNGQPIGAGVPGAIASMDLRGLDYDHTGLVYRNEIVAHIRETGVISAETGAALDGRLTVG